MCARQWQAFAVLALVLGAFLPYIGGVAPHCCEDINYLAWHTLEQRQDQFWARTVNEGRWFFALWTALLSGYFITSVMAAIAVLASCMIGMMIAYLYTDGKRGWAMTASLVSLNPFLLTLYPWPISFALFNLAHLAGVACYFLFLRDRKFLLITPVVIAVCMGTYQPSVAFLIEVVFLHCLVRVFTDETASKPKETKVFLTFLVGIFFGIALYFAVTKGLLYSRGITGSIRRYDLWSHRNSATITDYFATTFEYFRWFVGNGVSSGIDPASSALVGELSWLSPFIKAYSVAVAITGGGLFIKAVKNRSWLQLFGAVAALPASMAMALAPLIASGSGIISRVFYPFGLLLPTLLSIHWRSAKGKAGKAITGLVMILMVILHVALTAQFAEGIAVQAELARVEHRAMLERIFNLPGYKFQDEIVIYPYAPHGVSNSGEDKPFIDGRFWPLYNTTASFRQFIQLYQGYPVDIVSAADLSGAERGAIEDYVRLNGIRGWPHSTSVFSLPSVRRGIHVVYFPYPFDHRR